MAQAIFVFGSASVFLPCIMDEVQSELLTTAIRAHATQAQLKGIIKQLLWCHADESGGRRAIDRADGLCHAATCASGKKFSSLAEVQKELNDKKMGSLAKEVAGLKRWEKLRSSPSRWTRAPSRSGPIHIQWHLEA